MTPEKAQSSATTTIASTFIARASRGWDDYLGVAPTAPRS